jgi:predicted Zn-dependent peptidase
VGSRNEQSDRTGFAHLFEHLMFGGSRHVPDYDKSLQKVGADNNAFTNNDITNYYIILGADNIETALWAESDRMQFLNLDETNLANQKKVVIEEFKQRYLNVPYGDAWLKLRPLSYQIHPYRWPTIGMKIEHIEEANLQNVRDFHNRHYGPENAILTMSGNIEANRALELAEKWFGEIPARGYQDLEIEAEPEQVEARFLEVTGDVPLDAIYKTFHMPKRGIEDYYSADLLSDILGRGNSSRLHQKLVKEKEIFNNISASILGTADPGLLVVSGKVSPGIDAASAEKYLTETIAEMKYNLQDSEVEKVKNQAESSAYFSDVELLNRSINLAVANSLGKTKLVNEEIEMISKIDKQKLLASANEVLNPDNCSTLFYRSAK